MSTTAPEGEDVRISTKAATLSATAVLATATIAAAAPTGSPEIEVSADDSRPWAAGSPDNFTGTVHSKPLFDTTEYSDTSGGQVCFEPGARTAWHTHPAGQTLIVTAGSGWVQQWGGPKQSMSQGDVVTIPPDVKHWHGATADDAMTHIAVADTVDGKRVTWLEQVSPEQYEN